MNVNLEQLREQIDKDRKVTGDVEDNLYHQAGLNAVEQLIAYLNGTLEVRTDA
jgi:hypothetical protein